MAKSLLRHLFAGLLIVIGLFGASASRVHAEPPAPTIRSAWILEDPSGKHAFSEILLLQQDQWQPIPVHGIGKGYTTSTFWLKLELDIPVPRAILTLLPSFLDDVQFYVPSELIAPFDETYFQPANSPGWFVSQQGDFFPHDNRVLDWRGFSLDLKPRQLQAITPPNELFQTQWKHSPQALYVRVQTGSTMLLQLDLQTSRDFQSRESLDLLVFGGLIGGAFGFGLIGVVLLALQQRVFFACYTFFAFSCFGWYFVVNGFMSQWILPNHPRIASSLAGFTVCLVFGSVVLFLRQVIASPASAPRRDFVLRWTGVLQIAAATLAFLDWYRYFAVEIVLLSFVQWAVVASVSVESFIKKRDLPLYLLMTFAALIAINIIMLLGFILGVFPPNLLLRILQSITFLDLLVLLPIVLFLTEQLNREKASAQKQAEVAQERLAIEEQARRDQLEWVEIITHELKTPLTIIDVSRQAIGRLSTSDLVQQRLDKIARATNRLIDLIDSFVNEGELLERHRHLERGMVSVDWLVSGLKTHAASLSDQQIQCDVTTPITHISADRDLLVLALNNLLSNALRHGNASQSVVIRVSEEIRFDRVSLVIEMTNHGQAIKPDDLSRLFLRYSRFGQNAGSGLGLWATREIARAHGGDCSYGAIEQSEQSVRHSFVFWIPVQPL